MMDEIIDEGKIEGAIDTLNLSKCEKIIHQMKTSICKVYGQKTGTGFFCKINYQNEEIPLLMTNYHVLSDEYLETNKCVKISINDEQIFEVINIEENSKLFSSEIDKYDIMMIKIKEEKTKFNYLELDNNLLKENSEDLYENKSIYILHYPNGENICVSFGYGIKKLDDYYIKHLCNTEFCSSGSPILNLSNNKVIGIHKGTIPNKDKKAKYNIGILLKYPLNEIKEKNINEIDIKINILNNQVNKEIYFLDNSKIKPENSYQLKPYHRYLKELNKNNIELFINGIKEEEYKKYFIPKKEGIYNIKLKFHISIKDCSHMFDHCFNYGGLISLDLSNFDTKNVTNMGYMFYECDDLKNIDLSSLNTRNVINMNRMFAGCHFLTKLNVLSFDTKNVINMECMFAGCFGLQDINLSSFDTKNVTNMSMMFSECTSLKKLDLSSFDTQKVTNMAGMFGGCNNLENLNLSTFNTSNVNNMAKMFEACHKIKSLNLSRFNTKNVTNMLDMFNSCQNLEELDLSSFDTKNVSCFFSMFLGCQNLKYIDLSSFEIKIKIEIGDDIFGGCNNLKKIKINKKAYEKIKSQMQKDVEIIIDL